MSLSLLHLRPDHILSVADVIALLQELSLSSMHPERKLAL